MRFKLLLFLFICPIASVTRADFIISVASNAPLMANTAGQNVDILLTSDSDSDPALKGANFGLYIGNSQSAVLNGTEGIFSEVIVRSSSTFWTLASGGSVLPVPTTGVAEGGVSFNSGSVFVGRGNTVIIAKMLIDTTGVFSGNYSISLTDPFDLSAIGPFTKTQLIDAGNNLIDVGPRLTILNGSFTITAIPEPSSITLVGLLLVLGTTVRSRAPRRIVS